MAEGVLTEREWRRKASRTAPRCPRCWGAQCMLTPKKNGLCQSRTFQALAVMASFTLAMVIPFAVPKPQTVPIYRPAEQSTGQAEPTTVRSLSTVAYALPQELHYVSKTYTRDELLLGKLLLLDSGNPLPEGAPAPNTMSVAAYGKGMVPVNDLTVKSGKETIRALTGLFAVLKAKGAGGFAVYRGTMTPLEQRELLLERMRYWAKTSPLGQAAARALSENDLPGQGELLQEYTVELRLFQAGTTLPDDRPLNSTAQGRVLLQNAWRHGFVRTAADPSDFRFRYVGQAHATAMVYLDLDLKQYLELLHQKGVLRVGPNDNLSYLILCKPLSGAYVEFQLPEGCLWEASLDNTGYAVVACTLKK